MWLRLVQNEEAGTVPTDQISESKSGNLLCALKKSILAHKKKNEKKSLGMSWEMRSYPISLKPLWAVLGEQRPEGIVTLSAVIRALVLEEAVEEYQRHPTDKRSIEALPDDNLHLLRR